MARWAAIVVFVGLAVGFLAALGMLLSGPLYRIGVLKLGPAFGLMGLGAKIGMAALIIGIVGLILALFARRSRSVWIAGLAIVLGLLAFMPPWMFRHKAMSVPPIHDISTDTNNPPAFAALLPERGNAPNPAEYGGAEVADQQHAAYPDIKPLELKASTQQVFDAALATAHDLGWKVAGQDPAQGHIEATATTLWFGFKDDVVIRISPEVDDSSRLDIRSLSRVGKSDVGKNAERIRTFEQRIRKRLGTS